MKWISTAQAESFMPTQGTAIAAQVDSLYGFLLISSFIACLILLGGMVYFVFKYKRKTDNDKTAYISHNGFLEFLWSFIPLCIFLGVFAWGWYIYHDMRSMPKDALEVHVYGKQWAWDFEYKSGKKTTNEFTVPVGTSVKLIMTSRDVLHSFYVPSFRIKQDVVPGRYTTLWFQAEKLGEFHVFCTEYCGGAHSNMLAKIKVVPLAEYETWLAEVEDTNLPPAERGKKLYVSKTCSGCHSVDGNAIVGPSFKGLFGANRQFEDGGTAVADENYIRESILEPNKHTVKGYPAGAMPTFQGQVTEEELNALIEFIKGLK